MISEKDSDLSVGELTNFRERIGRTLKRYPLLPLLALQYRICEVSQSRPDARALRRALKELTNNRRPRSGQVLGGIIEPLPNGFSEEIFFEPEVAQYGANFVEILSQLTKDSSATAIECLRIILRLSSSAVGGEERVETVSREVLADTAFEGVSVFQDVETRNGRPVTVWLSHDLEWLYPDNVTLWKLVHEAARTQRAPIIVARKIAPATFSVLKKLGAIGIQYYSMLADPYQHDAIVRANDLGWVHTRAADPDGLGPLGSRLREVLIRVDRPLPEHKEALRAALPFGFDKAATVDSDALINWASTVQLSAPPVWFATVRRWKAFESYKRKTRHSDADDRLPSHPESADRSGHDHKAHLEGGRNTEILRVPFTLRG